MILYQKIKKKLYIRLWHKIHSILAKNVTNNEYMVSDVNCSTLYSIVHMVVFNNIAYRYLFKADKILCHYQIVTELDEDIIYESISNIHKLVLYVSIDNYIYYLKTHDDWAITINNTQNVHI